MKKFLTLVLALVMVLAIAAPAMAFTTDDTAAARVPYELDIYLVEYDDNGLFGVASLPPSDRGYAKNEIVAAIVELYVPKGKDPAVDGYTKLVFDGENVSLNVTENMTALQTSTGTAKPDCVPVYVSADKNLADAVVAGDLDAPSKALTFKWLFYAKVTGDDASLSASLIDGDAPASSISTEIDYKFTLDGVNYTLDKDFVAGTGGQYKLMVENGDYKGHVFYFEVNKNYATTAMAIATPGSADKNYLGFSKTTIGVRVGGVIKTSGALYENIMDAYEDVVVDVFGLDFDNIGNYLRDKFWTGLISGDTVTATVEIKPWTAYVTVPEDIVVDPPKTGDAASIVGFVMIVLAAAAAVVVKKVRA